MATKYSERPSGEKLRPLASVGEAIASLRGGSTSVRSRSERSRPSGP